MDKNKCPKSQKLLELFPIFIEKTSLLGNRAKFLNGLFRFVSIRFFCVFLNLQFELFLLPIFRNEWQHWQQSKYRKNTCVKLVTILHHVLVNMTVICALGSTKWQQMATKKFQMQIHAKAVTKNIMIAQGCGNMSRNVQK